MNIGLINIDGHHGKKKYGSTSYPNHDIPK